MNTAQMNPQQVNPEFAVHTDLAPLPSKGIFYPNKKDAILFEHMTSQDENLLTTQNLITSGRVLEELLKRKIKDTDINIDELLTGDINAILLQIRIGAYGEFYDVNVIDPLTGEEFQETIDLSKLNFKELTVMPDDDLLFSFTLPIRKKTVKFRLLTNKEEKDIASKAENLIKKNGGIDITFTERLKAQVMEIEGNKDKTYISKYIDTMPPLDALKLRNYISEVEPSLDLSYEFTNPTSGRRFHSRVFLSPRLFYPTT